MCNSGIGSVLKFKYRSLTGYLEDMLCKIRNNLLFSVTSFCKWTSSVGLLAYTSTSYKTCGCTNAK